MMLLQQLDARALGGDGMVTGTVARFTEIDMTLPWFDVETFGSATEEDVQTITIPAHLRPNYRAFFIAF